MHEARKSPNHRHESPVTRPIIRNNTRGSDHGDNLSNSSVQFHQLSAHFLHKIHLYLNSDNVRGSLRWDMTLITKNLFKFSAIFNAANNKEVEINWADNFAKKSWRNKKNIQTLYFHLYLPRSLSILQECHHRQN